MMVARGRRKRELVMDSVFRPAVSRAMGPTHKPGGATPRTASSTSRKPRLRSLYGVGMGFRSWVRERLVNADAVDGLILFSAPIAAICDYDSNALDVLVGAGLTLVVFWGAHVFAGALVSYEGEGRTIYNRGRLVH